MEKIIIMNLYLFLIVSFVAMIIGMDLRKWTSWLIGFYGFLTGSLFGLIEKAGSLDFQLGVIIAFVVMVTGSTNRFYQQRYKGALDSWLLRYGQGEHPILLARIVKKLMGK